ncbi:hypothetical protein GCM10027046_13480 [Uliginosibacterium flavum]
MLNDTGVTATAYDATGAYVTSCNAAVSGNDCNTGRDATSSDNSDGKAGFSFEKLDAAGKALSASASNWNCVRDKLTGLVWEIKTSDGGLRDLNKLYTNHGDNRSGDASEFVAAVNVAGLCGAKDWRLPVAGELLGLVDYGVSYPGPTIDVSWFPNSINSWYWSATQNAALTTGSEGVDFFAGISGFYGREYTHAVRLVRGSLLSEAGRYQFSADAQEVRDSRTGLTWRRCSEGQSWVGSSCAGSAATYTHAVALLRASSLAQASGKAWRMPNIKELESIVDYSRFNPAIDPAVFPSATASLYWTSSPMASSSLYAWTLNFMVGGVESGDRDTAYPLRLVR